MLKVIMLGAFILKGIMLSVIMLNVAVHIFCIKKLESLLLVSNLR